MPNARSLDVPLLAQRYSVLTGIESINAPDPVQDWSGDGFVWSINREDFRHVALALFEQHHRAIALAVYRVRSVELAQLVVQGLIEWAYFPVNTWIEFSRGQQDFDIGLLERG